METLIRKTVKELHEVTADWAGRRGGEALPPDRRAVVRVIKALQAVLFPLCFQREDPEMTDEALLETALRGLKTQLTAALRFAGETETPTGGEAGNAAGRAYGAEHSAGEPAEAAAEAALRAFTGKLPMIKEMLLKDIEALYEGDPAAKRREEVMICYPGFYAVSIYRLAHELYQLGMPLIPRIMTEFAHEKTGIDIHPGASIGEYFCIDHGTGIVIGETTVIGDRVKLYQGVTLGARSFELDEDGNPVKGIKRHPNIGNRVVIYANATILGGDTYIGDGCVIGGSAWLTHSVAPGSTVTRS